MALTQTRIRSVPYVDLARQHAPLRHELLAAAAAVIDAGQFILGREVERFEREFARLCGVKFAVGVSTGTDALLLSLLALGVGRGDEVVTTPNTFIATATAIALTGATPVFVDVGEDLNLDPRKLEAVINRRTAAILPVHLTGRPADMDAILEVAHRHGLPVVEDAAQAALAKYRDRPVGSFGCCGAFSLHPLKTLGACGDAGVITTNDPALDQKLRVLRNLGLPTRDNATAWSGNHRLDTMQAALLLVKLRYAQRWTEARRKNADFYRRALANIDAITLPTDQPHEYAVYHTFVIQADRRDELRAHLSACGVGTAVHYPVPIHLQDIGRSLGYAPGSFPLAEAQARRILSLPVYPELTHEELDHVAAAVGAFYRG